MMALENIKRLIY